jgi:diaminohydroxyphosphoribosylaminopyrimidine deaminase/5-amino-6-(5-phosphoribosylamino)uracil reductase
VTISPLEAAAMRRAIALSAFGLGRTSPNPPVGCVVLDRAGAVVGEGYHLRKGDPHAEANALAAAGNRARGGTAVVTLEPCNHYGRTPPCRQALLDAGIRRVVIAVIDPTSRGEGGAAVLRAAGVEVETDVMEAEARAVLGPWLASLRSGRPLVVWPYLVDGSQSRPLPDGLLAAEVLRQGADAVLDPNGRPVEAVPDSHGDGILRLDDVDLAAGPMTALEAAHAGGVRSLLVSGDAGERFAAAGLVDRIVAYLSAAPPSSAGPSDLAPFLAEDGFTVADVQRVNDMVRVQFVIRRSSSSTA